MIVTPLQNISKYYNYSKPVSRRQISFCGDISDTFEKSDKNFDRERLLKILNGDFRKLNDEFFKSLSKEEYQFCIDWARQDEKKFSGMIQFSPKAVLKEDVKEVVKYGDFFYSGLQNIAKKSGKDITQLLLVGIGQSPVVSIKLLDLIGVKTAYCPISGLTTFNEPIEKYVTKENVDKYFSFWRKFGFNIDDLFGDKLIVFTDHKETGKTFENFKKIIKRIIKIKKAEMGENKRNCTDIKFIPLREIYKTSSLDSPEKKWGNDFEKSVFHTSYLKTLYSPFFKLPLPKINEIEKRYELAKNSDCYTRFNRLVVLLYNELYNPLNNSSERRFSSVDDERQFRLSFYTPDM